MNGTVGAAIGFLAASGILLLVLGLRRWPVRRVRTKETFGETWARVTRRPTGPAGRRRDRFVLLAAVVTLAAFLITGLPVMLLVVPVLALVLPYLLGNPNAAAIERTAALDQWVRSLRSLLHAGSDNTMEGALQSSLPSAPDQIKEQVSTLIARINSRWPTDRALVAFADELADPTADVVAAALILASRRRGTGLADVLEGLSAAVGDEVRARRKIEAERASARATGRYMTVIFAALGILLSLFSPTYLAPYQTAVGQIILAVVIAAYLGALWLARRITTVQDHPRIHPVASVLEDARA
ncbi:type II secretion system F family protein [Propionibacteriaceae bacterium Y1685]|uniref:type II secretion system F family protein n=1 Tax=Microlunatus sp. Y1700 TaxID=3418487 RepID=UPI003B7D7534